MGGAIIYLVIVAVWAVVLVPRWLRKHDAPAPADVSTADEVEDVPGRVLTRRRRMPADVDADVDAGAADDVTDEPVDEPEVVAAEPARPQRRAERSHAPGARAHRLAVRRRLVFCGLLLAATGCGGAAVYGYLPWWSMGAPLLLVPLYLVHVRRVIVAEHARRRRLRRAETVGWRHDAELAAVLDAGERMGMSAPASVRAYRAGRLAPGMRFVERGALFDQDAPEPWRPQPVPLPTYLTAPAAPRAYESAVSVDGYDEESQPAEDAVVHDFRRAVGG